MRRLVAMFAGGVSVGMLAGAGAFAVGTAPAAPGDLAAAHAPGVPSFVEQTVESGLRHVYDGDFTFYVGGGVAAFDCNDDGRSDLYLAGGENEAGLFVNESPTGGDLALRRVRDAATDLAGVVGAYPLDLDSDGVLDLAVLRVGANVLLRGTGDCRFTDATADWGIDPGEHWTAAFSATWEGENRLPTLAFGNYLQIPPPGEVVRECAPSMLLRPNGPSGYAEPIALEPGLCTLSVLFSDWNRTGRADLRMANDRHYYSEGGEQLWRVEPGQAPVLYDEQDGWHALSIWGMGIAQADVTGDALPEVVLTSQGDNKLQTLADGAAQPRYTDIALRAGTTAHRPFMGDATYPSTAWHPELADVNNDGVLDLFLSKGNVDSQADHAAADPSNLLLGRPDGTFVESAREAGVVSLGLGRGAALVDLNLDGLLDLVEVNRAQNVRVWRNLGVADAGSSEPGGSWLAIELSQPAPNVDGIGSWVEVRTADGVQHRQITVGGGHAGGQLAPVHVGLGSAEVAEVRVTWPDGEVGGWLEVAANQVVTIERDE